MKTVTKTSDAEYLAEISSLLGLTNNADFYNIVKDPLSQSAHQTVITRLCNKIIKIHPECRNVVFALLTYSTQKWASGVRGSLHIDNNESCLISDEQILFEQYRGILKEDITPKLKCDFLKKLERSECLIRIIEKAVDELNQMPVIGSCLAKVIRSVHFSGESEEVSPYLLNTYYEMAVMEIYHTYGKEINELVVEMSQPDCLYGGHEEGAEYHNTKLLVKIYPMASHRLTNHGLPEEIWSDNRLQRDSNGLYLLIVFTKAIRALETYPCEGKIMCRIISMLAKGRTMKEIAQQLKLQNDKAKRLRIKAINLLSFVLWGYSTARILTNLVLSPPQLEDA